MSQISYTLKDAKSFTIDGYNPMIHGWYPPEIQRIPAMLRQYPSIRFQLCDGNGSPLSREALEKLPQQWFQEQAENDDELDDEFDEPTDTDGFYSHYPEILAGDTKGWKLKSVRVGLDLLELFFVHPNCQDVAVLGFSNILNNLHCQFDVEREDGSEPDHYQVLCHPDPAGQDPTSLLYRTVTVIHYSGRRCTRYEYTLDHERPNWRVRRWTTVRVQEYFF